MTTSEHPLVASCTCGQSSLKITGTPIMTVACYCKSCQTAAVKLGSFSDAPPIMEEDGGTHFVMQRKDHVSCLKGAPYLREHRLTPDTSTRRVVATCCHSAMFLEFDAGHWLSIYAARLNPSDRPAIEQRTMTGDLPEETNFNDAIPSPKKHTFSFMWKLLAAWAAMGFKSPKIDYVKGPLNVEQR